jgi:hypothetical protein
MKLLVTLLLLPFALSAQVNKAFVVKSNLSYTRLEYCGEGLFGFEKDGKIGYMNANQKVMIMPTLDLKLTASDRIPAFTNGFAVIKLNGKQGLIDKTGKQVIPCDYNSLILESSSKTLVRATKYENNKTSYGVINTQNKVVIPIEYNSVVINGNLVAVRKDTKWGLMDAAGKELIPPTYSSFQLYTEDGVARVEGGGKYGFIDVKGNWIFDKSKSVYTLNASAEKMIRCMVSNKYGYLDAKGNEVIITKYDQADDFNPNGLAKVSKYNAETKYKNLYGYINKKGEEIIPIIYETISAFENGLAYAKDPETNRYGYLDAAGKWVLKPVYLYATMFDETGGAWVKMTDNKYHYINKSGKDLGTFDAEGSNLKTFKDGYAVDADMDYPFALVDINGKVVKDIDECSAIYNFSEGMAGFKAKSKELYGFIDINGNKVIPAEYTGFSGFKEGISRVSQTINGKTKYGYINTKGEILVPFDEYKISGVFSDGMAVIKKDSIYYFMDKDGKLLNLPRKYDALTDFKSGFALGTVTNKNGPNSYYYINTNLQEAFNINAKSAWPIWEDAAIINRDSVYEMINTKGETVKTLVGIDFLKFTKEGKLAVRENKKWGFINTKGDMIIKPQYDSCDSYNEGYAKVQVGDKWGIIDKNGNSVIKPIYKNITPGENGIFVFYDDAWGIIDKTGKILSPSIFNTITSFEKNRALARFGKMYSILKSPLKN